MNYDSLLLSGIAMHVLEKMTGWTWLGPCMATGQALRSGQVQFRSLC